jgi:hypothetical protein
MLIPLPRDVKQVALMVILAMIILILAFRYALKSMMNIVGSAFV